MANNSFNAISYKSGVLTVNGQSYNVSATGNAVSGNSFSNFSLDAQGHLTIDETTVNLEVYSPAPVVDPILENNSWETIHSVCESGDAENYWAVGDTKTDVGKDNLTRTFRIVDMQGLYNKHVVFEQVELEDNDLKTYKGSDMVFISGPTSDEIKNNYYLYTKMNQTYLPYVLENKYSSELSQNITDTTIKTYSGIYNNSPNQVVEVTTKLFLAAEREFFTTRSLSRQVEFNSLTTFSYYTTHTTEEDRRKCRQSLSSGSQYWLRSPVDGAVGYIVVINSSGNLNTQSYSIDSNFMAPYFSF